MDEYIDREAAIESIMREPTEAHYPSWYAEKIKAIPATDVAPVVHGRWILVDTEKGIGVCSNCNRQDRIDHLATHCRFCGARMDLEEPNEAKESGQP